MTLYLSDMDGTLLDRGARISPFTERTIRGLMEKGMRFTVATGRTPLSAIPLLRPLPIRMPVILMNGALILDIQTRTYLHSTPLSPEGLADLARAEALAGMRGLLFTIADGVLSLAFGPERDERWDRFFRGTEPVDMYRADAAGAQGKDVVYALYMDDRPDRLEAMYHAMESDKSLTLDWYKDIYTENTWCLEVYSAATSKRRAVELVRAWTGADRLIGFGDNSNDLPLFEACDEGYAVANACDALKAAASGVIGANTDDGVARWLAEHAVTGA